MDRLNRSLSPTCQSQAIGSFSHLALFHNHGGPSAQGLVPVEEVTKLQKEMRLKQAEYDKERAILLQRTEQAESKAAEATIREQAKSQMYEAMLNSLKVQEPSNANQTLAAQIQASERQAYQDEIKELKEQRRKLQDEAAEHERDFNRQLNDKDSFIKDLQLQVDRHLLDRQQQVFQWELERKETQQRSLQVAAELQQQEQMIELRCQNRISELQTEMERLKLDHMRDLERTKGEYETRLREIKSLHEVEKQTLESRLDRQSHDLKSLHHMVIVQDTVTHDNKQSNLEHREQLTQELSIIATEIDGIKSQYEATVSQLTKEKEIAEERNAKLQKQLEKLKNAPKPANAVQIELPFRPSDLILRPEDEESSATLRRQVKNLKQEVELLQGENEKLADQVKRLRKEALEVQEYAERLEGNEKKLRQVLKEQATIEQDQVVELRRQLNQEKKRCLEQSEVMSQAKEALERENYKQASKLNEKDEQIRKLNKDMKSHQKKLYEIQSMFNGNPLNTSGFDQRSLQAPQLGGLLAETRSMNNFSPRGLHQVNHSMQLPLLNNNQSFVSNIQQPEPMRQVTAQEYALLQVYQRMADSAARMECAHCCQAFETGDFLDHIEIEHPVITKAHSQSQLLMTGLAYQQALGQSVCLSSRSQQNLLVRQPSQDGHLMQQVSLNLKKQNSPRHGAQAKLLQNNRSFNCLLGEIDEEEEKNLVGSIPAKGKIGRQPPTEGAVNQSVSEKAHSRNTHCSSVQNTKEGGGSMVNFGTGFKHECSQHSQDKKGACITSEIKDLLDKLVTYQGSESKMHPMLPEHTQSVVIGARDQYGSHHANLMSTDSLVELRSSVASSVCIKPQAQRTQPIETKAQEYKESSRNFKGHASKTSHQGKDKKKTTKENQTKAVKGKRDCVIAVEEDAQNSDSSPRKVSSSRSSRGLPSVDRMTARHTSKDTIISGNQQFRKRKGRRYHEVNKSDIITPNSPRRYQDYFNNKPNLALGGNGQHTQSTSAAMLQMLLNSNATSLQQQQQQILLSHQQAFLQNQQPVISSHKPNPSIGLNQSKVVLLSQNASQASIPVNNKNHRYSPSNTKSIADESQYNQMSPSPEKPTTKQYQLDNDSSRQASTTQHSTMPLQHQLQNQLLQGKASPYQNFRNFASYDSGTVLCGAASDAMFNKSDYHQQQLVMGGAYGFAPAGYTGTLRVKQYQFDGVNTSMEDDGEIRPSQIDEFAEIRAKKDSINTADVIHKQKDSYITIGDEDPFITSRFCDASTKQFSFKPQGSTKVKTKQEQSCQNSAFRKQM